MKKHSALLLALAALLPPGPGQGSDPQIVPVFVPDHRTVVVYREPALARTLSGTLIAVAEAHRDDALEAPWRVELVLRTSADNGLTWSPVRTIRAFEFEEAATRPSLIVDPATGRILLLHNYGAFGVDWDTSAPGTRVVGDMHTLHVQVMHSDDEGATWSESRDLNPEVKLPEWEAISVSSASGLATSDGRLIQPVFVRGSAGGIGARNLTSRDGGATWTVGPQIGEETHESCVIELADGSLLQNMTPIPLPTPRVHPKRRPDALRWRLLARAEDGQKFGPLLHDGRLVDSNYDAALVRRPPVDGDPRDLVLFANPDTPAGHRRLTLRWSEDGCGTWAGKRVLNPGPSGAAALALIGDQSVGVLFERGERQYDERISFARVDLAWLAGDSSLFGPSGAPRPDHSDLWAWFDAHDSEVNGDEGSLSVRLEDRRSGNRHGLASAPLGTGSKLPLAANGHDALRFLGALDDAGSARSRFGSVPGPLTITLVGRAGNLRLPNYLFDGSGDLRLALRTAPALKSGGHARWELVLRSGEQELVVPTGDVTARTFAIHTILLRQKTVHHFINGVQVGSAELPEASAGFGIEGLVLGTDGDRRVAASCDIAEVLVFRTALSGAQRKALENYLGLKFRL